MHRTRFVGFMVGAFYLLAAGSAAAGSPSSSAGTEPATRVVVFGTSLTALSGWPDELGPALSRCIGRAVRVERVAMPGATTDWALTRTDAVVALRPDVVLTEFYMNDAAMDRFISVSTSRAQIATVLKRLTSSLPKARIYLMGMNPVHGARGMLRLYLADYIEAHRAEAAKAGVGYIDFGPIWAAMSDGEREVAIYDGLHPKGRSAAAVMIPALVRELAGPCRRGGMMEDAEAGDAGAKNP